MWIRRATRYAGDVRGRRGDHGDAQEAEIEASRAAATRATAAKWRDRESHHAVSTAQQQDGEEALVEIANCIIRCGHRESSACRRSASCAWQQHEQYADAELPTHLLDLSKSGPSAVLRRTGRRRPDRMTVDHGFVKRRQWNSSALTAIAAKTTKRIKVSIARPTGSSRNWLFAAGLPLHFK